MSTESGFQQPYLRRSVHRGDKPHGSLGAVENESHCRPNDVGISRPACQKQWPVAIEFCLCGPSRSTWADLVDCTDCFWRFSGPSRTGRRVQDAIVCEPAEATLWTSGGRLAGPVGSRRAAPPPITRNPAPAAKAGARQRVFRDARLAQVEAICFSPGSRSPTRKLAQFAGLADGTEARTLIRRLNRLYDGGGQSVSGGRSGRRISVDVASRVWPLAEAAVSVAGRSRDCRPRPWKLWRSSRIVNRC